MLTIVGITGLKRSGKNTAAQFIEERSEFFLHRSTKIISFADELRKHLEILNPIVDSDADFEGNTYPYHWNEAIKDFGYETAKDKYPEMRRLMQIYGTEVVRERIQGNYWVSKVLAAAEKMEIDHKNPVVIIPDMRFFNECYETSYFCRQYDRNFILLQICGKDDSVKLDSHASEDNTWVNDNQVKMILENIGTIEEFREKCIKWADLYLKNKTALMAI